MIRVVTGSTPARVDAKELIVRVAGPSTPREACIDVRVADQNLADALIRNIAGAIRTAAVRAPTDPPVVHLRSRKGLARLQVTGSIAIVRVTERNARHLVELVSAIRAAGSLGVQLVWDGENPVPERVERHVFAALELARATPTGSPVVLAVIDEPVAALRLLIDHRIARQPEARC